MAEPTTQTPPETPAEDFVYRPLSGVAVAGVLVSGVFAVVLLVCGAVALWRGEPFLLPLWLLLLPVAGVALSLLGRWHILRSENTRAGLNLTRYGLWTGLVAGLGYGAFYFATGLAVTNQSNSFLVDKGADTGYLKHLQEGDVNRAFLLTRSLSERSGANPNDDEAMLDQFDAPADKDPRGLLSQFKLDPLVRRITAPSAAAEFEPLGVRNWSYENRGYKVERFYRVTTREGSFEVLLTTQSVDTPEGRKWFVHWVPKQGLAPMTLKDEGKRLEAVRRQSAAFANAWLQKLTQGQTVAAFLDTQPAAQRAALMKTAHALTQAQYLLASLPANPATALCEFQGLLAPGFLPGYTEFWEGGGCFHSDKLRAGGVQDRVRAQLRFFVQSPPRPGQIGSGIKAEDMMLAVVQDGGPGPVTVSQRFEFPLMVALKGGPQMAMISGEIVLETPAPLEPNNPQAQQRWRIARVNFLQALPMPMQGPGQGPPG
jgi:hypothetical protein